MAMVTVTALSAWSMSVSASQPASAPPATTAQATATAPATSTATTTTAATSEAKRAVKFCNERLSGISGPYDEAGLKAACEAAQTMSGCDSEMGEPIIHFEKIGTDKNHGKKILSISLIHGDERPSGAVNRAWLTRLGQIDPRNTWRVLPIVNPDGMSANTRYNSHKVDLNRNFPSKDWQRSAIAYWKTSTRSDARRYPGEAAASESETRCVMKHIVDFKPDFIISIHTPLGVLDFDGPSVANPGFKPLPWVGLGNFPGSLGRFMWMDQKVPVLTIELKGNDGIKRLEDFDKLQDIAGTVAIQAGRVLQKEKKK